MPPVVPLDSNLNSADVEALLAGLTSISLELTNTCNLNCVHCYAGSSPAAPLYEGMVFEDWVEVLQQSAALGCVTVRFIGGEPTVHPQLAELIAVARQLGFKNVYLYTNGIHFTDRLRSSLINHEVGLSFSLYAASPGAHDAVTKVRGSFARPWIRCDGQLARNWTCKSQSRVLPSPAKLMRSFRRCEKWGCAKLCLTASDESDVGALTPRMRTSTSCAEVAGKGNSAYRLRDRSTPVHSPASSRSEARPKG